VTSFAKVKQKPNKKDDAVPWGIFARLSRLLKKMADARMTGVKFFYMKTP
jgi:hypothetical protein